LLSDVSGVIPKVAETQNSDLYLRQLNNTATAQINGAAKVVPQ